MSFEPGQAHPTLPKLDFLQIFSKRRLTNISGDSIISLLRREVPRGYEKKKGQDDVQGTT
jgi:hypothetical protein